MQRKFLFVSQVHLRCMNVIVIFIFKTLSVFAWLLNLNSCTDAAMQRKRKTTTFHHQLHDIKTLSPYDRKIFFLRFNLITMHSELRRCGTNIGNWTRAENFNEKRYRDEDKRQRKAENSYWIIKEKDNSLKIKKRAAKTCSTFLLFANREIERDKQRRVTADTAKSFSLLNVWSRILINIILVRLITAQRDFSLFMM